MNKPPYAFTGPFGGCYAIPAMAMDPRHVYMVYEILAGWPFRNALELGSFCGASSTAFVAAINGGAAMVATFCDLTPTDSLWDVVGHCRHPDRVRVTREPSAMVLESREAFDFVLVDAGHDLKSVTPEIQRLLIRKPLCVMAHDTNATAAGYPHAEGAALLKRTFQNLPDYHCIEDAKYREDEETHRGLFLATTDARLYGLAEMIFTKWA